MANRAMKPVRSVSPGLTILATSYSYDAGVTAKAGPIKVTASDAKSVTLTIDRYADVVSWHAMAAAAGTPLHVTKTSETSSGRTTTLVFAIKSAAVDPGDGGSTPPSLVWSDNAAAYTASFTLVLKNTKARG